MKLSLVVAVARNGVIGREGGLPWRLSTDMKRFKAETMGKPVIMGRKTWDSFPRKPLPGRLNIVITRKSDWRGEGAETAASLDHALALAAADAGENGEVCVIGGGEIYAQSIGQADTLLVTHVEAEIAGDTYFPEIDPALWYARSSESVPAGEKDSHATRYVVYGRRTDTP